jgi:hypothetical protein
MTTNWQDLPVGQANGLAVVAATTDLPTAGFNGEIYFVLAEKAIYYWDSTAWQELKNV